MRLLRTILAFVIAASLAMLPIGASTAGLAISSDDMQTSMHMMGGADMSMDDCCPDDMKGVPGHTDSYKCGMGFCCVGGALAMGDVGGVIRLDFPFAAATRLLIPADQIVAARATSPPFRPPRV